MAYHSDGETQTSSADLLMGYLEEFTENDLKRLKYNLINLGHKKYQRIPKGQLENLDRTDLAEKMRDHYGEADSLNVMLIILKKMNLNNLAQRVNEDLNKRPQAGSERADIPEEAPRPVVPKQKSVLFVDQHRTAIIQRVTLIDPILDDLHGQISEEKYSNIRAGSTSQDRMRRLYEVLNTDTLKELFFASLKKNEPHLVLDL